MTACKSLSSAEIISLIFAAPVLFHVLRQVAMIRNRRQVVRWCPSYTSTNSNGQLVACRVCALAPMPRRLCMSRPDFLRLAQCPPLPPACPTLPTSCASAAPVFWLLSPSSSHSWHHQSAPVITRTAELSSNFQLQCRTTRSATLSDWNILHALRVAVAVDRICHRPSRFI